MCAWCAQTCNKREPHKAAKAGPPENPIAPGAEHRALAGSHPAPAVILLLRLGHCQGPHEGVVAIFVCGACGRLWGSREHRQLGVSLRPEIAWLLRPPLR